MTQTRIEELRGKMPDDVCELTVAEVRELVALQLARIEQLEGIVGALGKQYIVKRGPQADTNQYGQELLWSAVDVTKELDAGFNPWMCLAAANDSYSLACIGPLKQLLEECRAAIAQSGEASDLNPDEVSVRPGSAAPDNRIAELEAELAASDERLRRAEEVVKAARKWCSADSEHLTESFESLSDIVAAYDASEKQG